MKPDKLQITFILFCLSIVFGLFTIKVTIPAIHSVLDRPKSIVHKPSINATIAPPNFFNSDHMARSAQIRKAARTHYGNAVDTLINADTVYFYLPEKKDLPCTVEIIFKADSLAGSTRGTAQVQTSVAGLIWEDQSDIIINGSSPIEAGWEIVHYGEFSKKYRILATSANQTQKTRIQFQYAFSKY